MAHADDPRVTTTDGPADPGAQGPAPGPVNPLTGQHASYWILTPEEPGSTTRMAKSIAETYAREPKFYGATFCVACQVHAPVGEFTWLDDAGTPTEALVGS